MADRTYNRGFVELSEESWENADIRVLLLQADAGLTFDETDVVVADVLAHADNAEVSGTGYAREVVPGRTSTQDNPGSRAVLDHGDIEYTAIDVGQIGAAVYYRHVSDDSDSPVWAWRDVAFSSNGSDMALRTGSAGIATVRDAP